VEEIKNLLLYLKENYVMFFGKKSFTRLTEFVGGYTYCMFKRDGEYQDYLPKFGDYVTEHCDFKITASHHWSEILLFSCHGNEERAFDRYFELMEEFEKINRPPHEYPSAKWISQVPNISFTVPDWNNIGQMGIQGRYKYNGDEVDISIEFRYDFSEMRICHKEDETHFRGLFAGKCRFNRDNIVLYINKKETFFDFDFKKIKFVFEAN